MAKPGGYRGRARGPAGPVTELHRLTVKLFDQGDGRAIDWPKAAEVLFKVAFRCLDEAGVDERAAKVVRRVHDGAYNRMSGTPDNGLPYTTEARPLGQAGPGHDAAPGYDLSR